MIDLTLLPFELIESGEFRVSCRDDREVLAVQQACYRHGRRAGFLVSTKRDGNIVHAFPTPARKPDVYAEAFLTFDALMEAADIARAELERAENIDRRLAS